MTTIAVVIFWICAAAMVHTYLTYPLSLKLFRRRFAPPPEYQEGAWPTVAVLIPAYNEEAVIRDKVRNSLELEYEAGKLEILVGSDGSTDRTNEIVKSFNDPRVKLIELGGRNGKPGVLNHLVKATSAEILIMTDANVMLRTDSFRRLIRHFADSGVAAVATVKEIIKGKTPGDLGTGEGLYHRRASQVKALEGVVGGFSGACGAYYAMRAEWFRPLPAIAMNDDIISLLPAVLAGKRVAFEPSAVAYEESGSSVGEEFQRRIRIGASNYKTMELCSSLLSPARGIVAYSFFSHKVLRWLFPFCMLGLFVTNLFLLSHPLYYWFFVLQVAGYVAIGFTGIASAMEVSIPVFYTLYSFVVMQAAFLAGWIAYLRGSRSSVWEPTKR
jgi:cellulose synthase/poly-beta-1,6-N-acetylglucosamine synthase-like glycosyltransferase